MDDASSLRRLLLEMKSRAGLATAAEREELGSSLVFVGGEDGGGPLVVRRPCADAEQSEIQNPKSEIEAIPNPKSRRSQIRNRGDPKSAIEKIRNPKSNIPNRKP